MTEGLEAEALVATGLAHGFFTRRGGVSRGVYRSLNVGLGSGDDPAHVAENRARAMRALGADALATPYQVHGAAVHVLTERADETAPPPRADAMVTTRRGIAIGVVTADCVPVLLADAGAGVIAAAHAGWRGLAAGVVEVVSCDSVRPGFGLGLGLEAHRHPDPPGRRRKSRAYRASLCRVATTLSSRSRTAAPGAGT